MTTEELEAEIKKLDFFRLMEIKEWNNTSYNVYWLKGTRYGFAITHIPSYHSTGWLKLTTTTCRDDDHWVFEDTSFEEVFNNISLSAKECLIYHLDLFMIPRILNAY